MPNLGCRTFDHAAQHADDRCVIDLLRRIRDLLNPVEMPFDKTIRRMHILVRTMHEDATS